MLKLTRINKQIVLVNPDHIFAADAHPDTTLRLVGGDVIIIKETLDELIDCVVAYRRRIRDPFGIDGGRDALCVAAVTQRQADDDAEADADDDDSKGGV